MPFLVRTPDGSVTQEVKGQALVFGMRPKREEKGLGPYVVVGRFPAQSKLLIPLVSEGDLLEVAFDRPFELAAFRFGHWLRGVWFET